MALHFHSLEIKQITKLTPDCVCLSFIVPNSLQDQFKFIQGQSLTIRKIIAGEEVRRSYSICNSIQDNELTIAIKKVEHGIFSSFANTELKEGDKLDVLPPSGNFFTTLRKENKKKYIAFAAGSGITPILSIIKTTLEIEEGSFFTLIYGNRHSSTIIFKEQLAALKDKYLDRFILHHILSRERMEANINYGRIDSQKCEALSSVFNFPNIDAFFICGPEKMIFEVKDFLLLTGIAEKKIHFELFTTPHRKPNNYIEKKIELSKDVCKITVKLDGRSVDFDLDYNSNNILDAALAAGADLPFACKGGVCCTCKAKLIEGEIEMEVNYGLEADEVKAGFILTCQSHPRTSKVVVDFDVK